ncbi:MAG: hypothetical protein JO337_02030 [Acidimicrobiales bacterium]|nr:hypothetical protein [Acidimicrobiales bacterium]
MGAMWALARRRYPLAIGLALLSTLSSPLAGAFVALAAMAWIVALWQQPERRSPVLAAAAMIGAALGPVAVAVVLFPGQGPMPYPVEDWAWEMVIAGAIWPLAGRDNRAVRVGVVLFVVAATLSVTLPSSLGGNVGRMEDVLALPLAAAFMWSRARVILPFAAVPLALSQWGPAWGAFTSSASRPSTHPGYFAPLDTALRRLGASGPAGRVEVVPTAYHWEAAYVAPVMPLARGWERQLDVADNPLFYGRDPLTPDSYQSWLIDNGVRFVALPDSPLDMAARAEAQLVRSGTVPGLQLVWRSSRWRLYSVLGSSGIVSQPARLISAAVGHVVVDVPQAGTVLVRVRYSPNWTLDQGDGCISRSGQSWISVTVPRPEQFTLGLSLLASHPDACPPAASLS